MAFSLGSFFLFIGFWFAQGKPETWFSRRIVLYPEFLAPILFALGSLPWLAGGRHWVFKHLRLVVQSNVYFIGLIICVISLPNIPFKGLWIGIYPIVGIVTATELAILFGMFLDLVFVAFFRWVLRQVSELLSVWTIAMWLMVITVAAVLLIGPAFLSFFPAADLWGRNTAMLLLVTWTSMTNLVDAFCLLLLIAVMLFLLAHRLLWPLIQRPVYSAHRRQLIKNSKLLGTLGTMLLLYAFPHDTLLNWIKSLLRT